MTDQSDESVALLRMRHFIQGSLLSALLVSVLLASGCGSDDASLGGNGRQDCGQFNWRSVTNASVVCPGVPGCACGGGEVCCADRQGPTLGNGRCTTLTACPSYAFSCDGPEDCPSTQVCCAFGNTNAGGAECRDAKDCFFSGQELTVCRAESDCDAIESCVPADPGSYFDGLVARCEL